MTDEQEKLLGLLKTFARICEENGLRYYLAGGTLLGAVRHEGFIPWDDDVDVMMPEEDFRRFMDLERQLPEGLFLQTERTDPDYPFLFPELCDTRFPFEKKDRHGPVGIYIDIFPLIPSRCPTKGAALIFDLISVINYVLQVKCRWTEYEPYKKKVARLGYALLDRLPKERLRELRRRLAASLHAEKTDYCLSAGGGHKGTTEFYPKSWLEGEAALAFEGRQFPVPSGWDAYLRQLYGDYMTPISEQMRRSNHR